MSTLAIILGGGMGQGLSVLTQHRAKPALPYAGKYRIIDFPLSNLVNSGLNRIALLAQFQAAGLVEHLGSGEAWGLLRQGQPGLQTWLPELGRTDREQYVGTADAVYQNRKAIAADGSDTLLILSGDQICQLDYRDVLSFHIEKEAALSIVSAQVPIEEAHRYGLMRVDEYARITSFIEKPLLPEDTLASLGMYVFNTAYLLRLLEEDAADPASRHDFGRDIIAKVVAQGRAYAYPMQGYWVDIGTVEGYWQSSMALLEDPSPIQLRDPRWVIHTRSGDQPPVEVRQPGKIINSLVSEGCEIRGVVIHSILSPGVRVEEGAVVRDSVILNNAVIRSGAVVDRCVIDEEVSIGSNAHLDGSAGGAVNQEEPEILNAGFSVVGKRAQIPDGAAIAGNCRIDADVTADDFTGSALPAGNTVHHRAGG